LGPVALVLDEIWGPGLVLFAVVILLFPDGRLPSRFWRGALRAYGVWFAALLAATGAAIAGALAAHPVRVDDNGGLAAVDQPAGWFNAVQGPLILVLLLLSLAFIARQALSWRRATGERRQQLKWLASGAAVSIICLFLAATFSSGSPVNGPTLWGVLNTLAWMGVAALPVSIGVAILKYRLYEIDRIISRTLAYAIVTGLLVGAYAGLVLLATQVLRFHSTVAVAASTLAAALFSPLRRRVQHVADRRFNRARYNADQTVAAFAARLKDAVDLDAIRDDLAGVASQALEPAHLSVWISQRD
jgi:MFS family permease